jgi:hypothetical protein
LALSSGIRPRSERLRAGMRRDLARSCASAPAGSGLHRKSLVLVAETRVKVTINPGN